MTPEPPPSSKREHRFIFVDWAGDAGFEFEQGSSRHLVVAAVFTSNYSEVRNVLAALRRERRVGPDFHFHYAAASRDLRRSLPLVLRDLPFTSRVVVADKRRLPEELRGLRGNGLIGRLIAEVVVTEDDEVIEGATLLVDGDRREAKTLSALRQAISRLRRERGVIHGPAAVKARPASQEAGLQVADIVAGIAYREGSGRPSGLSALSARIRTVELPEKENRPG